MHVADWKWTPTMVGLPLDRQPVAVKMLDSHHNVHYGVGWYDAKESKWFFTALLTDYRDSVCPEPVAWVALSEFAHSE